MSKIEIARLLLREAEATIKDCEDAVRMCSERLNSMLSLEASNMCIRMRTQYSECAERAKLECEMYRDIIAYYKNEKTYE